MAVTAGAGLAWGTAADGRGAGGVGCGFACGALCRSEGLAGGAGGLP